MANFIITGPDGKRYRVSGANQEGALAALKKTLGAGDAQPMKGVGTRLWENIVGDNDPTTQNTGEKIGSLLNMAGESMTMGLIGDEASAAVAGAGAAMIPGGKDFGAAYADRRDFERNQQAVAEEDMPVASTVAKVAGAVLPAALMRNPQTVMGAAGMGAGMGGFTGFMEGEGSFENRATNAAAGTVIGGALGAASIPLGKAVSWAVSKGGKALGGIFSNRKFFANGQLTDEGAATLQALGYNLDDLDAAFKEQFQRGIKSGLEPQQAAATASLDEFGIPAFRANVTGLADDFATLERGRRGALGPSVTAEVSTAMNAQDAAMRGAGDEIATRMAGGIKADAGQAAETAMTAARAARDTAKATAGKAYDDLAAAGAGVQGAQVQGLGTRLSNAVARSESPVRIDAVATPNAANAATYLDDVFASAKSGSVPFMDLERARQQLVRYRGSANRGSNGADTVAMEQLVSAFDKQVDDLMTSALTEGDAAVLGQAKNARALWAQYRQQFTGDGAASKFIQKMTDEDASPDQVVNWLFGAGKLGSGSFNATVARGVKDAVGEDAWGMIRSAAFRKLIEKPEGMTQMGPQAISERIGDFFTNPATRDLSRTLFTPQEVGKVMRYQAALKRMVPPAGAVNYSGTAYENARMARNAFNALTTLFGGMTGGVPGMIAAKGATSVAQRGSNWLTGKAILSPSAPLSAGAAPRVAGAIAGTLAAPAGEAATNLLSQGLPR